jgi:hypothetical protein
MIRFQAFRRGSGIHSANDGTTTMGLLRACGALLSGSDVTSPRPNELLYRFFLGPYAVASRRRSEQARRPKTRASTSSAPTMTHSALPLC